MLKNVRKGKWDEFHFWAYQIQGLFWLYSLLRRSHKRSINVSGSEIQMSSLRKYRIKKVEIMRDLTTLGMYRNKENKVTFRGRYRSPAYLILWLRSGGKYHCKRDKRQKATLRSCLPCSRPWGQFPRTTRKYKCSREIGAIFMSSQRATVVWLYSTLQIEYKIETLINTVKSKWPLEV